MGIVGLRREELGTMEDIVTRDELMRREEWMERWDERELKKLDGSRGEEMRRKGGAKE